MLPTHFLSQITLVLQNHIGGIMQLGSYLHQHCPVPSNISMKRSHSTNPKSLHVVQEN